MFKYICNIQQRPLETIFNKHRHQPLQQNAHYRKIVSESYYKYVLIQFTKFIQAQQ